MPPPWSREAAGDLATSRYVIRDVDLPGLFPVAVILLILKMGSLLGTGFEKVLLLQNGRNLGTSEVLDTYVWRVGFGSAIPQYSLAAER